MRFMEVEIPGVLVVDVEAHADDRGLFARTWCEREFAARGVAAPLVQCSVSFNQRAGTLRGMHYQAPPEPEGKLVRCTRGRIYDVVLDLRPDSPTYLRHLGVVLSAQNRRAVWIPEGCAHGFLTLEPESEVFYQMNRHFAPELSRVVRWNDPAFAIEWPGPVRAISPRDATAPDFNADESLHGLLRGERLCAHV
ncbi:MAG: dTDP-4-dehydrorhamnose 3,5-epimerase [Armatimonadota bacterium]